MSLWLLGKAIKWLKKHGEVAANNDNASIQLCLVQKMWCDNKMQILFLYIAQSREADLLQPNSFSPFHMGQDFGYGPGRKVSKTLSSFKPDFDLSLILWWIDCWLSFRSILL